MQDVKTSWLKKLLETFSTKSDSYFPLLHVPQDFAILTNKVPCLFLEVPFENL